MKKILSRVALGLLLSSLGSFASAQSAASATTTTQVAATAKAVTLTAEQEKQVKAMLKQTMKGFEDASLTAEQEKKADELFSKGVKEVVLKRDAAKITPDMVKKQTAALKEARDSGKKGKGVADEAFKSAGFSDEQTKVFKEAQEMMNKVKREFAKGLKEEQIKKLPEQMQKMLKSN